MNKMENRVCTVKRTLSNIEKDSIWRDVCFGLETKDFEDLPYCILHMPTYEKDHLEFNRIIENRLNSNYCDYRAIFFPTPIERNHVRFTLPLNFLHATFLSYIDMLTGEIPYISFDYATFYESVRFYAINFSGAATFTFSHFKNRACFMGSHFQRGDFNHAIFDKEAEFNGWVNFHQGVDFSNAKFFGKTDFTSCNFLGSAKFNDVEFISDEVVSFKNADFQSDLVFDNALINGFLNFKGRETRKVFGENSSLSLQNIRVKKSDQISFHTVELRPNWFINTDSREFAFTNIIWKNFDKESRSVTSETEALKNRTVNSFDISNPNRLLQITYRQLAENAENNNRFEEASKFRQMAFETEWLEKKEKISNWIKNLVPESEKLKRRFGGSTDVEDKPKPPTNTFGILRRSGDFFIHGLYRITSFYGESWSWALGVLLSLILIK